MSIRTDDDWAAEAIRLRKEVSLLRQERAGWNTDAQESDRQIQGLLAENERLRAAVYGARSHIITLGGDPRTTDPKFGDKIQMAVLDTLDAALAPAPPQDSGNRT